MEYDEIIEKYRASQKDQAEQWTYMTIAMGLSTGALLLINGLSDWMMIMLCGVLTISAYRIREEKWKNYHTSCQKAIKDE